MSKASLAIAIALVLALALAASCKESEPAAADERAVPAEVLDAGTPPPATFDAAVAGSGEYHLDDDPIAVTGPRRSRRTISPRPIEIILRSTPPGANAAVDGQPIGTTPTLWAGVADGRARDFTFSLPGFAVARYRFVATRGGVVHGTLRRFVAGPDAGPPPPDRPAAAADAP